jgi:ADP-heptose:LPS heptosyltransferase
MRYLVLRAGALGDVVLSFPALYALKGQRFDVHLTFVGRSAARCLAREVGLADEIGDISSVRFTPLFSTASGGAGGTSALRAFLAKFDVTVSLLSDPDGAMGDRLRALGARSVLSFGAIRQGEGVARQLFRVLRQLGLENFPVGRTILSVTRRPPVPLPQRFVVFHVGSGSPEKNWPSEHFAALACEAADRGYHVLLPQGEADADPVARVAGGLGGRCAVIRLSLVDLAAVISRAAFFIGNDSGVTHVAGLLGVHTVAVFGPTDPVLWQPEGPRVYAVRGFGGSFPSPEAVRASGRLGEFLDDG